MPRVDERSKSRSYRIQEPYSRHSRHSTHEIERQLREKARQKILESQLINKSRKLKIDHTDKWLNAFNFGIDDSIKNTVRHSGNFGVPFSTPETSNAISRYINPLCGIRGENSSGVPGTDCFVCALEALNYGELYERDKIAKKIDPKIGFRYKSVDEIMIKLGRQERLFTFIPRMEYLTLDTIDFLLENIANILLLDNTAIMLVIFRSTGIGHYTVIQKKSNQITIIEPQPGNVSCGIPKSVKQYLMDQEFNFVISNIGFLISPNQADAFNNIPNIVKDRDYILINYNERQQLFTAQGIKKTRRKKNKDKQVKSKQVKSKREKSKREKSKREKSKREKSRKLRVKKVKSRKLKNKKNKNKRSRKKLNK